MELTQSEKDILLCLLDLEYKCEKCSYTEECMMSDEFNKEAQRILIKLGAFNEDEFKGI